MTGQKHCPGRRFWGFPLKTSNYPRTQEESASFEDRSFVSRGKHLTASLPKPSIINHRLALPSAIHHDHRIALQLSRESFRLAQRVRRARLAPEGLAGCPLSPLHTYYATAPQTVERPGGSVMTVALRTRRNSNPHRQPFINFARTVAGDF
jgi:hypothetical protein